VTSHRGSFAQYRIPKFLDAAVSAAAWRVDRPFIAVPKGTGSLQAFWECAGGRLLRVVDTATRAKCVFIASGIPGSVGSGTRALWMELAPLLGEERHFGLWPFDGSLQTMLDRKGSAWGDLSEGLLRPRSRGRAPAPAQEHRKDGSVTLESKLPTTYPRRPGAARTVSGSAVSSVHSTTKMTSTR